MIEKLMDGVISVINTVGFFFFIEMGFKNRVVVLAHTFQHICEKKLSKIINVRN